MLATPNSVNPLLERILRRDAFHRECGHEWRPIEFPRTVQAITFTKKADKQSKEPSRTCTTQGFTDASLEESPCSSNSGMPNLGHRLDRPFRGLRAPGRH